MSRAYQNFAFVPVTKEISEERWGRLGLNATVILPSSRTRMTIRLKVPLPVPRRAGYYPSQPTQRLGVKATTAAHVLQPLVEKGYVVKELGKQRNVRLTDNALKKLEKMGVNVRKNLKRLS